MSSSSSFLSFWLSYKKSRWEDGWHCLRKTTALWFALLFKFYTFNHNILWSHFYCVAAILPQLSVCVCVRKRWRDLEVPPQAGTVKPERVYKSASLRRMSCLLRPFSKMLRLTHTHAGSTLKYGSLAMPESAHMHTHKHTTCSSCKSKVELEPEENGKRWRQRYKESLCPLSNAMRSQLIKSNCRSIIHFHKNFRALCKLTHTLRQYKTYPLNWFTAHLILFGAFQSTIPFVDLFSLCHSLFSPAAFFSLYFWKCECCVQWTWSVYVCALCQSVDGLGHWGCCLTEELSGEQVSKSNKVEI